MAIRYALALGALGLMWQAPVCSSWVWCNRGTSARTYDKPLGDTTLPSVVRGNVMVFRCMMLALVAQLKGAVVTVEQPTSSLMSCHPAFAWFNKCGALLPGLFPLLRYHMWMGMYGGGSPKSTVLWSSARYTKLLKIKLDSKRVWPDVRNVSKIYWNNGKRRMMGGSKLKSTQAYPVQFGLRLGVLHSHYMEMPTLMHIMEPAQMIPIPDFDWAGGAKIEKLWERVGISKAFKDMVAELCEGARAAMEA